MNFTGLIVCLATILCTKSKLQMNNFYDGNRLHSKTYNFRPSTNRNRYRPTTKNQITGKLSCDVCYGKLKADVNTGWVSGRIRSHVRSSVSGYNNCKQKSDLQCGSGNLLSFALSTQCLLTFNDDDYQVCITDILKRY